MGIVRNDTCLIIFTEKGYAKRTALENFPAQKRYGGGVQAAKLTPQTGKVAVAALAGEDQSLVLMTAKGRVTKLPTKAIHALGRTATGHKSRLDTKESFLDPAQQGPPALLTVLAGTKTAARAARAQARKPKKGTSPSQRAIKGKATAKKRSRKPKSVRSAPKT
jgi:DNA gyrase subunit A